MNNILSYVMFGVETVGLAAVLAVCGVSYNKIKGLKKDLKDLNDKKIVVMTEKPKNPLIESDVFEFDKPLAEKSKNSLEVPDIDSAFIFERPLEKKSDKVKKELHRGEGTPKKHKHRDKGENKQNTGTTSE